MKRVLVCGGRDFSGDVDVALGANVAPGDLVMQGGARGADRLAARWAERNGVTCETWTAAWDKYGKAAGAIRNRDMLDRGKPHLVVAFPGGNGTAHMVKIAKAAGVPVVEVKL